MGMLGWPSSLCCPETLPLPSTREHKSEHGQGAVCVLSAEPEVCLTYNIFLCRRRVLTDGLLQHSDCDDPMLS